MRWRLGDGTTKYGRVVRHRYAKPGLYDVRVVARDAVGNKSHATRTVLVKPAVLSATLTRKVIHVRRSAEWPRATRLELHVVGALPVRVQLRRTHKLDGRQVQASMQRRLDDDRAAIRLSSRIGGVSLPPGTYRITVLAEYDGKWLATKGPELRIKK